MQKVVLVIIFCVLFCSGCVTTDYFGNRGRDAADILTFSMGTGIGAKARVGIAHVGLIYQVDRVGLRGGRWSKWDYCRDVETLFIPVPAPSSDPARPLVCSTEDFELSPDEVPFDRGKHYQVRGKYPFITTEMYAWNWHPRQFIHPYYTQIEVCIGLGGALRIGFNPGELVDFCLGWVKIDIFDDDKKLD